MGSQFLPDGPDDVFRGGYEPLQKVHIHVQVFVVYPVQNHPLDDLIQFVNIHHHAKPGIWRALDGDLQLIIVAMAVGVVALAENTGLYRRWLAGNSYFRVRNIKLLGLFIVLNRLRRNIPRINHRFQWS
jgi:hypothetical protein